MSKKYIIPKIIVKSIYDNGFIKKETNNDRNIYKLLLDLIEIDNEDDY